MDVSDELFIGVRFQPPAIKFHRVRRSAVSIFSLILLGLQSYFFLSKLCEPQDCNTRLLLETKPSVLGYLRNQLTKSVPELIFPYHIPERTVTVADTVACESTYYAAWTLLAFVSSAFGSLIGFTLETYLFLHGAPFFFDYTPISSSILSILQWNYAFLVTATALTTFALTFDPKEEPQKFLIFSHFALFLLGLLGTSLYFNKEPISTAVLRWIVMIQQVVWIFSRGTVSGGVSASYLLVFGLLCHILGDLLCIRSTPTYSTIHNLLASITSWAMYNSVISVSKVDSTYTTSVAHALVPHRLYFISLILSFFAGYTCILLISRATYQAWRTMTSYIIWSTFYFGILRVPRLLIHPVRLSVVYSKRAIRRITLRPYSEQHDIYMPKALGIPSINGPVLLSTVEIFSTIRKFLTLAFNIITFVGNVFPQADVTCPLQYKERMKVWEDGSKYFPASFFFLSQKMPHLAKTLHKTPQSVLDAFVEGRLLAHMCQYGIGNSFLRRAIEHDKYPFFKLVDRHSPFDASHGLVLDLSYLDHYESKADYEPYGGIAFFRIRGRELCTEWVIEPRALTRTFRMASSAPFRRIEGMIRASLVFCVIAGKHLAEIHLALNLLEIALHNSFDYELNPTFRPGDQFKAHPFRLLLYIHLFSHGLAVELTVCHLLQERAVFSQIFALTHSSLCEYLTNAYNNFRYSADEDFEERRLAMRALLNYNGTLCLRPSFTCALQWELEYNKIFEKYANSVVDAIYVNNQDVKNDAHMKAFFVSIATFRDVNAGPGTMETKAQIKRFLSDTIFHIIIKHQIYGTEGVIGMLDPRINSVQVPRDGGPPAIDEWRSLVFAAIATAHPSFSLLLQDQIVAKVITGEAILSDIFRDATPINDDSPAAKERLFRQLKAAFDQMQQDLRNLNNSWEYRGNGERARNDENYMYGRCLPAELRSGAGY